MTRRARIAVVGAVAAATAWPAAATSAPPPAAPVVAAGPDGAYAVAVPGLAGRPAIGGGSVVFAVEDELRGRLFSIAAASADGTWRSLYAAPAVRPGSAARLRASPERVIVVRYQPDHIQSCVVGGECTPAPGALLGGPASGPLERVFRLTERLEPSGSCRRRIAQLDVSDSVGLSGERIAYARRVRCMSPRRRGRSQLVVRNLRTGAVRVVHRGIARRVELAGRYLAFERAGRRHRDTVAVVDLRSGRVAYRAKAESWYSLGDDGVLAVALFGRCCSLRGRLAWYSPQSPRRHVLPTRVSAFSDAPLAYANGRIAYVRSYGDGGATLAVTDLRGRARVHARFATPEWLEAFDFDGERLAFAHTRFRPDTGPADDGLRSICIDDGLLVQDTASVIEVHAVTRPARMPPPQLPSAAPYRSESSDRPDCPYRD